MSNQRCPLTVKFGRDVAWLIYRQAWIEAMGPVHDQLTKTFSQQHDGSIRRKSDGFMMNYRNLYGARYNYASIYHSFSGDPVADLSINY